jgi:16S rRNA processing protein RimM
MRLETVLIGKVVGVHALKGEVKVFPYGEIDWIEGESLYPVPEGTRPALDSSSLKVSSIRPHKGVVLVIFEAIDAVEEALPLVGLELYIDADRLPELKPGEYYHQDLLDMEVLTEAGQSIGRIIEVITTGANDVYQVTGPDGEMLLPALKEVIINVDVDKKKMVVKLLDYEPDDKEQGAGQNLKK